MLEILAIIGIVVGLIAATILTLVRGILVDRTQARNKQFIMDHYGGLTGWPTEDGECKTVQSDQQKTDSAGAKSWTT